MPFWSRDVAVMNFRISLLACLCTAIALSAAAQASGPRVAPGLDGKFIEIQTKLPGFGGYFFDDNGDLNVYLTDTTREPDARTMFADVAQSRPQRWYRPWTKPAAIVIRQGTFDFATLNDFRTRLASNLPLDGISMYDTDEANNVVFVAVTSEEARQRVLARAAALGLPPTALTVRVEAPMELATSLRNQVRPTVGGLQIEYNSGASQCTLGANVWYGNIANGVPVGTEGFYTASHCSATPYDSSDHTVYTQGSLQIGHKVFDPPTFTPATNSSCLPSYNKCRWSDVAFCAYDSGVSISHGVLAQTLFRGVGPGAANSGSIDLNMTGTWTFTITNTVIPVFGTTLERVGRGSGWTEGNVSNTCADVQENIGGATVVILCAVRVGAFATFGDSGGPVFQILSSGRFAFSGIVFSTALDGTNYQYADIDQIARDMGIGVNYMTH